MGKLDPFNQREETAVVVAPLAYSAAASMLRGSPARSYAKINTTSADAKLNAKQFPALLHLQLNLSRAL